MATQIVPAPASAEDQGQSLADRLAHEAASHVRVTAHVASLLARYRAVDAAIDRLSSRESHYMTPADWRELETVQDERYELHQRIADAGQLHLIEVSR